MLPPAAASGDTWPMAAPRSVEGARAASDRLHQALCKPRDVRFQGRGVCRLKASAFAGLPELFSERGIVFYFGLTAGPFHGKRWKGPFLPHSVAAGREMKSPGRQRETFPKKEENHSNCSMVYIRVGDVVLQYRYRQKRLRRNIRWE